MPFNLLQCAMLYSRCRMEPLNDIHAAAAALVHSHGARAHQVVVDRMIDAIRAHDMRSAHYWDDVGKAMDALRPALATNAR